MLISLLTIARGISPFALAAISAQTLLSLFLICTRDRRGLSARTSLAARRLWESLREGPPNAITPETTQVQPPIGGIRGGISKPVPQAEEFSDSAEDQELGRLFAIAAVSVEGSLALARVIDLTVGYLTASLVGWTNPGASMAAPRPDVQKARDNLARLLLKSFRAEEGLVPHGVYLREFSSTGAFAASIDTGSVLSSQDTELEALTADVFWSLQVCFIAVGDIERGVFGAGRLESDDEGWKGLIEGLVTHADWIVLLPGTTRGVLWEMELLHRRRLWDRVVFLMPWEHGESMNRLRWSLVREALARFELMVPEFSDRGCIFAQGESGWIAQTDLKSLSTGVRDFRLAMLDILGCMLAVERKHVETSG